MLIVGVTVVVMVSFVLIIRSRVAGIVTGRGRIGIVVASTVRRISIRMGGVR
jgi:hypothetical protein